jgi:hypothetical protein
MKRLNGLPNGSTIADMKDCQSSRDDCYDLACEGLPSWCPTELINVKEDIAINVIPKHEFLWNLNQALPIFSPMSEFRCNKAQEERRHNEDVMVLGSAIGLTDQELSRARAIVEEAVHLDSPDTPTDFIMWR